MPAAVPRRWTYQEVQALIEGQEDRAIRYEFADGALLVTPAPGGYHQRVILALYERIAPYVRAERLGEVRLGPSEVHLPPGTIFQPDLYVVPGVNGARPRADVPVTRALLVVEVLSTGSQRHDRLTKRRLYQQAGVDEYWIMDLDAGVVERWRPADSRPDIVDGDLTWHPSAASLPLVVDLTELFRGVRDD